MTAWNQLIGAMVAAGIKERNALNMVYDVLHEEAARVKKLTPGSKWDPTGPAWKAWEEARDIAAGELDPDDPNWTARCTHCYQPWDKNHVCHVGWYDWTRNNKTTLVDMFAHAMAVTDARMWKTRTPNEDDPMWIAYKTYGLSCWEELLEAIRSNANRELKKAASSTTPVGGVKGNPLNYHPEDEEDLENM